MTFVGRLGGGEFLARHWRRRPLLVRGGADELLPLRMHADKFGRLAERVERKCPANVKRDGSELTFVQQIDSASPALAAASQAVAAVLPCRSAWIDGVLARDGRSIGCHYDHSDNFVVQQDGVKVWRLHNPSVIPRRELRQRMRNEPGIGAMFMPDDYEEFVLEPGDVLYIPLLWIHHGISSGPSLSLSVVCNPDPSDTTLQELLGPRWQRRENDVPARPRSLAAPVIDEARVEAFFAAPVTRPDPADLVLPRGRNGPNAELMRALARPYLRRLLVALVRASSLPTDPEIGKHLRSALLLLQALDDDALERLVVRPELTSWTLRAAEALRYQYVPRVEEVARHLGAFLLPALLEAGVDFDGDELLLEESEAGAIDLLPLRRCIRLEQELSDPLRATVTGDVLVLRHGAWRAEVPVANLLDSTVPVERLGRTSVEPLHGTARGEVALIIRHRWFEEFLPRGRKLRVSQLHVDLDDAERALFARCLDEGLDLVHEHWRDAWEELGAAIFAVMPLKSHGVRPHNETIPAFRGLIRTSARPSYLAAQSLVHETGHNKLNSILDLHTIVEDDQAVHWSPFVGEDRPMIAILHGIFAFMVDAHISVRLAGRVAEIEGLSIPRYVAGLTARLEEALTIVDRQARLTEAGTRLRTGFAEAFDALNTASRKAPGPDAVVDAGSRSSVRAT